MIQSNGNNIRRQHGNQFAHKVVVGNNVRQPVNPAGGTNNGKGTNLNNAHVPIVSVPHVTNPLQRQRG